MSKNGKNLKTEVSGKFYLLAGMRFFTLLKLIFKNLKCIDKKYYSKIRAIFKICYWTSVFGVCERIRFNFNPKKRKMHFPPVFIVGHWRTGSTFLHQLLNCDPELAAPTLFEIIFPDNFLYYRKIFEPRVIGSIPEKRPIDNVNFGLDEPQEDEYSLLKMTGLSPIKNLMFPSSEKYFLLDDFNFLPEGKNRKRWIKALSSFIRKINFYTKKRVVIKNPFHSLRIAVIKKIFPDALFIHIYRDPRIVIPSTIRMWSIVSEQNAVRDDWIAPKLDHVIDVFDRMITEVDKQFSDIPEDRKFEIKFEELEKAPKSVLQKLYNKFGFNFSDSMDKNIDDFLKKNAGYKKNSYNLSAEEKKMIDSRLAKYLKKYGYKG